MSQNPYTKDYILVLSTGCFNIYCKKCGKEYTDTNDGWCKPCQIIWLKEFFKNQTSGNKEVDDFIQKMQLEIDDYDDEVFEWIPYNQFTDIKEIDKDDFNTVYSAEWKDGPLNYNIDKREYIRNK